MKDGDEFNYEVYFGSASIFTLTFGLGILSEFIGTFVINFMGLCVCLLLSSNEYNVGVLSVGMVFGLAYLVAVTMLQEKGSCHFNPCISLSSLFLGQITLLYCFVSILVQIAGATLAASLLHLSFGDTWDAKALTVSVPSDLTMQSVLTCEFFGSLLILCSRMVPFENIATKNYFVATATFISTAIFLPYSGGSLNPARALGPSISYHLTDTIPPNFWVYWAGPLGASVVSVFLLFSGVLHRGDLF